MLNSLGLGFIFTAKDLASGKMAGLQRRFSSLDDAVGARGRRMSRAFRELGVGLAVFTAGAVGLGGTFALANRAGKFEQGLAGVGAVTKATAADMDMLHKSAIDAGIATQFSPDEAVEGLTSLATAGQTARQATETLIPVLDLAAGSLGQLGVSESAEAVVGTLNAYGIAARDAAGVTDKLLRITQLTNFQARDFEAGLSKAAATGAVFDQSLNDVLVTMGLIRNRNIDASSAATGFREATRRVGSDLGAQKALMSAGIDIFDKSTGKMRSIVDIMLEFSKASSDLTDKERNKIIVQAFGARGLLAYNAVSKAAFTTQRDGREVTLKGAEAVEALRKEMEKSGGTAKEFRERLLDTFQGQKTLLKGSLQTLAVVVGEAFSKVFKPVVSGIITVVNDAIYAWERLSPAVKSVIAKLLVFASTFLAVLGAVMALKGAFAMIRIGMAALGITFSGFLATFGPILLLIGGAAVVFYGFRQAFDLLHDGLFTVDLLYAMVGYALTSRLIDAQIRSSEPTLLGWAVTLVCYTPFWGMLRPAYFDYDDADAWGTLLGGHPMLYTVWGSVILALLAVYVLSTIYFGTRFSNLTYRGLLSSGPYRLCKHPAYVCKNLSWWLIAVPVVSSQGWQAAVRNSLRLLLVNLIYFARARTEERHLGRYPEYADERARRARLARSPGPGAALQAAWRELISWS